MILTLVLRYPPSINRLYWTAKGQEKVLRPEHRDYREETRYRCLQAAINLGVTMPVFTGAVAVEIDLYRTAQNRSDIDAGIKTILDSLNQAAYPDDRLVKRLTVEMIDCTPDHYPMPTDQRCVVRVRSYLGD